MKNFLLLLAFLAGGPAVPTAVSAQTPTEKQLQAIEKLMAPNRQKVTAILEADKTGQYKTYQADLAAIAKETDLAKREELIALLERNHLDFIRKSYQKAVINHEEQRKEVARILGHNNFTFGEFADIQIDFTPPALALPQRFDTELLCPMEISENTQSSQVASDCIAQASNCYMSVQSLAEIAGGCKGKTSLGNNFVLPEGSYSSITVSTQTDISYHGLALAVAGYGQVNAKFGTRFKAPGQDKIVHAKEVFALAPIVWLSRIKGDFDNFPAQATFTGTFTGGTTITAQAYMEGFALSVPVFSFTAMYAYTSNIDFIRLSGTE